MIILGLSFGYHDSAAALVVDGNVIAAAQEERFTRKKHENAFPEHSIDFCLKQANITPLEIDEIVFYEKPFAKFLRVVEGHINHFPFSLNQFCSTMPNWLGERLVVSELIKKKLTYAKEILFSKHHLSHAASAYYPSGSKSSAIIISDGIGEKATISWGVGENNKITMKEELYFPHSLGLLYSAVSSFIGVGANSGEGKTMGLADWGKPIYKEEFNKFLKINEDGSFTISQKYLPFGRSKMYSKKFIELFGTPRSPEDEFSDRDKNLAATLQFYTEEILIKIAKRVYEKTKLTSLCLAGGSFLNIPTNSRILKETNFTEMFVQPAAGDAGGALGAALLVSHHIYNENRNYTMSNASLGPSYSDSEIIESLNQSELHYKKYENEDELFHFIAGELEQNKVLGLFQGRMEFGPRALGNRSIIASPNSTDMKDILNLKVKIRESFRPYGVSILADKVDDFFETDSDSPFMLALATGKDKARELAPSSLHINNTSRLQTVKDSKSYYYKLINEFYKKSGIPMIINTSFNKREPIVCSPVDAINCFKNTKMDFLIMENYVITKN